MVIKGKYGLEMSQFALARAPIDYSRQPAIRGKWLNELTALLAFPTVSALPRHQKDLAAAAFWLQKHLAALGLQHCQVLPGPHGGAPSVYADWLNAPGKPTVLFYGHYDVQPVDPVTEWRTPPFRATLSGQKLFARGASDDKGQLFAHLKALESYLATGRSLPLNVKVWLEGEEEINSPNLRLFLEREGWRLKADAAFVSDTSMLGPGRPSIVYSLRGNLAFELEVSGPKHDLHSGRYGGAVLNPLQALSEILAGFHDRQGRVAIPGFYQAVRELHPAERQELACASPPDEKFLADLDLRQGWGESGFSSWERTAIRPALTINGLNGGYTGPNLKTIIPAKGLARLSFRLVPDQDPAQIERLLKSYIARVTPGAIAARLSVSEGAWPVLVPRRHPAVRAAARAVYRTWAVPPTFTRSGGTISLVAELWRQLKIPIVLLGFGLDDDDIHAPNEKLNLLNFFLGVETVIRFLEEYSQT